MYHTKGVSVKMSDNVQPGEVLLYTFELETQITVNAKNKFAEIHFFPDSLKKMGMEDDLRKVIEEGEVILDKLSSIPCFSFCSCIGLLIPCLLCYPLIMMVNVTNQVNEDMIQLMSEYNKKCKIFCVK